MTNGTNVLLKAATIPAGRAKGASSKTIMVSVDGSKFYCSGVDGESCDYVADSYYKVMSHRNAHRLGGSRNGYTGKDVLSRLHRRAADLLADIETIQSQPAEPKQAPVHGNTADWRARAHNAERELAKIKRTFASLNG